MLDLVQINDIEAALEKRGLPVAELCRRAEVDPTTWWRWKTGRFFPSFKASVAVEDAFKEILAETGDPDDNADGTGSAPVQGAPASKSEHPVKDAAA